MSSSIRVAHIGLTHSHARGLLGSLQQLPNVEIVGFSEHEREDPRALLPPALQDKPVYTSVSALLEETKPQAVVITLSNDQMPDAIIQAARQGIHVFAEKPCGRTAAEFRPAAAAIEAAGVQFATGYLRRATARGRRIKQMADEGLFGRLVSIETRWITTSIKQRRADPFYFSQARSGGGMLHLEGCHWIDFMRWATSAEIVEVSAQLGNLGGEPIDVEDTAVLAVRFDNGMLGSLHGAHTQERRPSELFCGVRGMTGWARWEENRPEFLVHSTHPAWSPEAQPPVDGAADVRGYGSDVLDRFFASIEGREPPLFTAIDALKVLEVIDAAHELARTGRAVTVGNVGSLGSAP